MAMAMTRIGENSLFLLLLVSAVVSVILGMGMPSVPAYTLVAVLVAPALVQLGALPMAAHLFIFYFAVVSNFTPPVALACFAAAPLARESANKIGYVAMRLGIVAYVVPFLFVYSPTLILVGEPIAIIVSVITAVAGAVLLAAALVGYLFKPVGAAMRLLLAAAGFGLLIPVGHLGQIGWILNAVSAVLAALLVWLEWQQARQQRVEPGAAPTDRTTAAERTAR